MNTPQHQLRLVAFSITLTILPLLLFFATITYAIEKPNPAVIARMRYELEKVEATVRRSAGKPFNWSESEKKIFRQLQELAKKHPDHSKLRKLIDRAKTAYRASGGNRFVITKEMLAYRERSKNIEAAIGKAANQAWAEMQEQQKALIIAKPFPTLDPLDIDQTKLINKLVLLKNIRYEEQLFIENGRNYVAAGDPSKGYYFIASSSQNFNRLFDAVRRYRSVVKETLPDKWSFVCELNGVEMLTPEGGAKAGQGFSSHIGWSADPIAIYIPDTLFVSLNDAHEKGASFVGEDKLDQILSYSITTIPDDISPEELLRLYIVALKEKNFDLHIECHAPDNRYHPGQIQTLRYYWELQQKGIEREHAHAEPVETSKIRIIQGGEDQELDSFFGDPSKGGKKAFSKIEKVTVTVQLYNADGIQTVRPRLVTLTRKKNGRWYIESGGTLMF